MDVRDAPTPPTLELSADEVHAIIGRLVTENAALRRLLQQTGGALEDAERRASAAELTAEAARATSARALRDGGNEQRPAG